ncbi:RNA polymerase I-specific transcription initiation factor RRN3 [Cristinia sonorae]|uniref:RNA polymerase I-specific transcription initiation factor RRN3 n=1 Tax=Cristinia sonorae TaxID=1940300 RepID=A0A8K0ULF1_9AGAR|nr:RNA polymerase I-specific transcription initiation factor RRN3 [Cristinia sonorae]
MDPHSRHSQFNTRKPKAGPSTVESRRNEVPMKSPNPLESFSKRSSASSSSRSASPGLSLMKDRPMATNSRIKQDEQFRKDIHLTFVTSALQQKAQGNSTNFDELVDQFNLKKPSTSAPPTPAPPLRMWILALSNVVSRLERCHSALVEAVVGMPWTIMDNAFVKSYTSFVGMLVSAKPEYLGTVLAKLAHGFTYQSGLQTLEAALPESSNAPLTRRVVYERIHYLLRHIITLVPTLPSTLQPLLVKYFPHKRQSQAAQVTYIRNLLQVIDYCPELTDRILATIIDRAIQIDVEIQVELEELEEQLADREEAELFELDPFDTIVGQEGEDSDSESDSDDGDGLSDISSDGGEDDDSDEVTEVPSDYKHINEMVQKLDAILKNLLDHFNNAHRKSSPTPTPSGSRSHSRSDTPLTPLDQPILRPDSPTLIEEGRAFRRTQFYTLLSIFDRVILRTFKSRYTQFLIFWYSSLDPEFSDVFQGMLVSKALFEEDQPSVTRAAAASYIASFVSRAQFVDKENTRRVVACLCDFLRSKLDRFEEEAQNGLQPSRMAQYSIFYAVAQAVFLIFCFRWRDLTHDEEELEDMDGVNAPKSNWMGELDVVKHVVTSELNPLKMCSTNVVMQFAKVAHSVDFLYCYPIIEANRRSDYAPNSGDNDQLKTKAPLFSLAMMGNSMQMELNTFFPFDPYKLPRSGAYIEGVYREWSSVAIDDDEDDDDDEEEEDEEVAHTGAISIAVNGTRSTEDDGGLGQSFGGMSISPIPVAMSGVPMSVS